MSHKLLNLNSINCSNSQNSNVRLRWWDDAQNTENTDRATKPLNTTKLKPFVGAGCQPKLVKGNKTKGFQNSSNISNLIGHYCHHQQQQKQQSPSFNRQINCWPGATMIHPLKLATATAKAVDCCSTTINCACHSTSFYFFYFSFPLLAHFCTFSLLCTTLLFFYVCWWYAGFVAQLKRLKLFSMSFQIVLAEKRVPFQQLSQG